MKSLKNILWRLIGLALLGGAAYFFAQKEWNPVNSITPMEIRSSLEMIGKPAADFTLPLLDDKGSSFRLSSLRGKGILLNFWATWCVPCIREMPALIEIAKKYRDKNLVVVAIAVDKDWPTIERFFTRYPHLAAAKKELVLVLDQKYEAAQLYSSNKFPETFLINKNFVTELRLAGEQPWLDPGFEVYYDRISK